MKSDKEGESGRVTRSREGDFKNSIDEDRGEEDEGASGDIDTIVCFGRVNLPNPRFGVTGATFGPGEEAEVLIIADVESFKIDIQVVSRVEEN